ncbi:hypothetical protein QAD02_014455, partial [Eretmocerus hayati]
MPTREGIHSLSGAVAHQEGPDLRSRYGQTNETISGVKFAWIAPNSPKLKDDNDSRLHFLMEQVKFYCDNSSLAGYKYITKTQRTWFERILWLVLHFVMAYALGMIVYNLLLDYKHTPVVTVVDSDNYPSNLLDLPAVAVCSINRISRKAVENLSQRIKASQVTNMTLGQILHLLSELGNLYESSFDINQNNRNELDDLLRQFYGGNYQLGQLMKELTPQCNDILVKCRFRLENRNCSELFSFRRTQDGFCCTFNYIQSSEDTSEQGSFSPYRSPYKIEKLGMLNGLTFLMEPFLDDYFFPILPITGWKITVFNPTDYPDNTSGGVSDALISPGTENFLELDAVSFFSEAAVRGTEISERKCIFGDEISALYDGYTYSDCIVDCKVTDIESTCGCRPFFYPVRDSRRVCNTSDVECLHRFK